MHSLFINYEQFWAYIWELDEVYVAMHEGTTAIENSFACSAC